MRRVFIDTWGWYGYIGRRDAHHSAVKPLIDDLFVGMAELYTSRS